MSYTSSARLFDALGDPTRREIFERLHRRPMAVGELAQGLPVSRPAVSQHLKVLKEVRLVEVSADGARRIYSIDIKGLGPLREWLDSHWGTALDAFKDFADRTVDEETSR